MSTLLCAPSTLRGACAPLALSPVCALGPCCTHIKLNCLLITATCHCLSAALPPATRQLRAARLPALPRRPGQGLPPWPPLTGQSCWRAAAWLKSRRSRWTRPSTWPRWSTPALGPSPPSRASRGTTFRASAPSGWNTRPTCRWRRRSCWWAACGGAGGQGGASSRQRCTAPATSAAARRAAARPPTHHAPDLPQEVGQAACARWQLQRVALAHRTGVVRVGEASVVIAASSAHRRDALEVRAGGVGWGG